MSLTAPHINALDIEGSTLRLFEEFMRGFFDGGSHTIGSHAAAMFPAATLKFQQAAPKQPIQGLMIALTWPTRCDPEESWDDQVNGLVATAQATWICIVRAPSAPLPNDTGDTGVSLVTTAASRLYALFACAPAVRPLNEKGLHDLKAELPQLVASTDYETRFVVLHGTLRYPVGTPLPN